MAVRALIRITYLIWRRILLRLCDFFTNLFGTMIQSPLHFCQGFCDVMYKMTTCYLWICDFICNSFFDICMLHEAFYVFFLLYNTIKINNSFANKNTTFIIIARGHGSIGRASVSHTEGCGFESH